MLLNIYTIGSLAFVGDGADVALLDVTGAVGVEKFLEVFNLGLEFGTDVGIVYKNALMGVLDDVARGLDVLAEAYGFVNR